MTNWFTKNSKVLTKTGKIRGCCCTSLVYSNFRINPAAVAMYGNVKKSLDMTAYHDGSCYFLAYEDVYETPYATVTYPYMVNIMRIGDLLHVVKVGWDQVTFYADLGIAPASGSATFSFMGNSVTVTRM